MRIALCHKRLDEKGGTERDFYLTAQGLRDLGHEVHLFCGDFAVDPPAGTFAHRIPVLPFGRTARLLSFACRAPAIVQRFKCDVFLSFGRVIRQDVLRSGGGSHKLFLEKLGAAGGPARAWWQRVSLYHRSLLALERRQFENSNFKMVIAVSAEVKRDLMQAYGVPESKIVVLYNGVDPVRFHPSLKDRWRAAVRAEFGVPDHADVVLFVGNGFYRKGLDFLLRVWRAPELNHAFLVVVGADARLGAYRSWAERQAPGRIIFVGRQERIERFYAAADVVALPAVQEAFGNVVLEALATGLLPVVSSSVGASELLTGPLAEGIVTDPGDARELRRKLIAALLNARRHDYAVSARRTAEAHSWEKHFRRLEDYLLAVCRRDGAGRISEFVHERSGVHSVWMDRRLAASELSSLFRGPDALLAHPACEIIKDQRKVKIGRVALSVDNRQKTIYVKRYNAFSWRYKLGSLFMRSASMAALEGAQTLAHAEIDALRPLGAVEWRRCGVLHGSAFFSEEIEGGHTADDYWRKQLAPIPGPEGYRRRRAFLSGLASLLKQLHQKSIYHNDLKDANIMVRNDCGGVDKLFLLDLEGVRRCWYVSRRRRIKNLVQLNRTLGNFLSQADKLFFLKIYLGSVRGGARTRRPWARRVLRATRGADLRSQVEKTAPRPT